MANNVQRLNTLLNKKNCLYNEFVSGNDGELINILIELVNSNYIFTSVQVNKFIGQACTPPYNKPFIISTIPEHIMIIKYIFMNFNICNEKIKKICAHRYLQANRTFNCIDYLFEKKHNFTMECFEYLYRTEYDFLKIDNYDVCNNNIIFMAFISVINIKNNKIFNKLLKIITKSNTFNIEYLEIIRMGLLYRRYNRDPSKFDKKNLILLLDAIFTKSNNPNHKDEIIQFAINNKIGRDSNTTILLDYIIDKFDYSKVFAEYILDAITSFMPEYIFKLSEKGHKITIDEINKIYDDNVSFKIINTSNYKHILPTKRGEALQKYGQIVINTIDLFEIFKIKPNLTTLNIAHKRGISSDITFLTDIHNIIPEKSTLDICIGRLDYDLISSVLKYKLTPDDDTFYNLGKKDYRNSNDKFEKIIELLIMHGLVIGAKHINYLISNNIYLAELGRFGVAYDEELYFMCYLNNYFPAEYLTKFTINPILIKMYDLCKSKNLKYDKLITFLKSNDIKLDRYALDYLINSNINVGVEIMDTYKCIPSIITAFKQSKVPPVLIEDIMKKYNVGKNDMFEQYVMNV